PASVSAEPHGSISCIGLSSADLLWHGHRGFPSTAGRLWSWPALHLRHVDSGSRHSLFTLPVVYGVPQSASGLELAELPLKIKTRIRRRRWLLFKRCIQLSTIGCHKTSGAWPHRLFPCAFLYVIYITKYRIGTVVAVTRFNMASRLRSRKLM